MILPWSMITTSEKETVDNEDINNIKLIFQNILSPNAQHMGARLARLNAAACYAFFTSPLLLIIKFVLLFLRRDSLDGGSNKYHSESF